MATAKKTIKKTSAGLSAPWWVFAGTLEAIFANDETVKITTPKGEDEEGIFEIEISSCDAVKLAAITKVIGESRQFGNITVSIVYNLKETNITADDIVAAFGDTGYFDKVIESQLPVGSMAYVVMFKDIIQVYADNTRDYYGNINTVVADAITEVLDHDKLSANVAICTKADKDPE